MQTSERIHLTLRKKNRSTLWDTIVTDTRYSMSRPHQNIDYNLASNQAVPRWSISVTCVYEATVGNGFGTVPQKKSFTFGCTRHECVTIVTIVKSGLALGPSQDIAACKVLIYSWQIYVRHTIEPSSYLQLWQIIIIITLLHTLGVHCDQVGDISNKMEHSTPWRKLDYGTLCHKLRVSQH